MKLLLDEMYTAAVYTAAVAEQLRGRDHDVIAVAERADLRGTPDEELLDWARAEDRALVTDNHRDFIPIHHRRIAGSQDHKGLILTNNRRFPRGQPATTGKLVVALEEFLDTTAPAIERIPASSTGCGSARLLGRNSQTSRGLRRWWTGSHVCAHGCVATSTNPTGGNTMRMRRPISAAGSVAALLALAPAAAGALAIGPHSHPGQAPGPLGHKHRGPSGCRISLIAEQHQVTSGEAALLSGALSCSGGGAGGQTVTIYERMAGVPGFKVVGTATTSTSPEGAYTFTSAPLVTDSTFYAKATRARSAEGTVRVAPQVTLEGPAEGTTLETGFAHRVTFEGKVNPIDTGAEVWLERESATSTEEWRTIQAGSFVQANGTYTIVHRFVVPGDADLRAVVRRHGKFDVEGESNTLSYEIDETQNPNLTLEPKTDPVVYGQPVTLTGVLKTSRAGQKVILNGRPFGGSFTKVAETTTGAGGAYEITIPSASESTFYKTTSGTTHSATVFEGVKWSVDTATVTATKVTSGQEVTFSGTVSPDRAGHFVYLERQNAFGGGYHVVDLSTVSSSTPTTGTFSIRYNPVGSGKQVYRIKVPGDPLNQAGSSAPIELEVTPSISPPPTLAPTTLPR